MTPFETYQAKILALNEYYSPEEPRIFSREEFDVLDSATGEFLITKVQNHLTQFNKESNQWRKE